MFKLKVNADRYTEIKHLRLKMRLFVRIYLHTVNRASIYKLFVTAWMQILQTFGCGYQKLQIPATLSKILPV